ncbi:M23 family metallopeptidase [Candidatus Parabeggiatoa sp. HSG14]|uniref:M23 family metallopeptidase n=1 Tax=Candidatus Parabeggiatoa sp. HSG14 TaxID=3055593 RepID=UPI0025A8920D|nr:M23 family metallopeptidase [Thiotrichales bacterium HSG14]
MNKINPFLILLFLVFPIFSEAGTINNIFVDNSVVVIEHNDCQLQRVLKENRKLILQMGNCASKVGQINIFHPNLKKIHWAQHDPQTVWIVVTFSKEYQFDIISQTNQYRVCFPFCYQFTTQQRVQEDRLNKVKKSHKMMFLLDGILFKIPLENMLIEKFLDLSIGYVPEDIIRDGLPHFGSKRGDWQKKTRKHLGYDIYTDQINVIASAPGTVTKIRKTYRSGLYVKLHHGSQLYTVYVHLKTALVKKDQIVKQGDIIGKIDGSVGNAVAPQLHFEIKPNNISIDPLPLIEDFYQKDGQITDKIKCYKKALSKSIENRDKAVRDFLNLKNIVFEQKP